MNLHPNLTRDLATVCQLAATQWLGDFFDQDEEAGRLACEMVAAGSARLELVTTFDPSRGPAHRLLLLPAAGDGLPVEVVVLGCQPVEITPEGLAARFWFFGRLAHWQSKH